MDILIKTSDNSEVNRWNTMIQRGQKNLKNLNKRGENE